MSVSLGGPPAAEARLGVPRFAQAGGGVVLKLVAVMAALAALSVLAWRLFLPTFVTHQIRIRTGFDAEVAQFACNPFAGTLEVRDLVVTNPPTFPVTEFVHLKHFSAKAERRSLGSNELVFETMEVDLASVTLVKRTDGTTNSFAFERNLKEFRNEAPNDAGERTSGSYLVKKLHFRISQLTLVDYVRREQRKRVYKLDLDQAYLDVSNLHQLVEPATLAALEPVGLAASDFLPGALRAAIEDALKPVAPLLRGHARESVRSSSGFFDALEESKKP